MNLEQTTTSLLEQFPTAQRANIQKQERMLERFGQITFAGFGLVILTAIGAMIYMILTKMVLSGTNFWSGLLLIAFVFFAGLALTYVLLAESVKEKKQKLGAKPAGEFAKADTEKLLGESTFEPIGSVTENTTELLKTESRTRKL